MGQAPKIPQYKQPSGQPSFMQTPGIDPSQFQAALGYQGKTGVAPQGTSIPNMFLASGLNDATNLSTPEGQAMMADLIGYNMSDADLAARYPQLAGIKNQYLGYSNNLLGTQTPQSMAQGNALMTAGRSAIGTGSQIVGTGQGIANQAWGTGQPDLALGQKLINGKMPMDPLVQQELMRAGLGSAASALGGAAQLGGTAGQAAVGRQMGVGAQNWINQQRQMGMALQQTGVGNISGLAGAGSGLIGAGTGEMNAGTGMVTGGAGIVNNAAQTANATFGETSSLFQPRTFGLSGTDAANVALSNIAGQNNMNQYLYNTKVQAAQQNTQISGLNANAAAQSQGNMISGGAGVAASAAAVGVAFAMSCWVARECFGEMDPRFYRFRFWLMNLAPKTIKSFYLRHGREFAQFIHHRPVMKVLTSFIFEILSLCAPAY